MDDVNKEHDMWISPGKASFCCNKYISNFSTQTLWNVVLSSNNIVKDGPWELANQTEFANEVDWDAWKWTLRYW